MTSLVIMKLRRVYNRVRFEPSTIEQAFEEYLRVTGAVAVDGPREPMARIPATDEAVMESMAVRIGGTEWTFDDRHEFLAELHQPHDQMSVEFTYCERGTGGRGDLSLELDGFPTYSTLRISGGPRPTLARLARVFDKAEASSHIPEDVAPQADDPRVFIGHGRSELWKDLKNHLTDHQKYAVVAYETGARSGHSIRDVLDSMLNDSSFAILIMTAEDEQPDGTVRARQNVVHEAGLFQGRLGFPRVAILMEEGVDPFSNIDGIQYIPFSKGNIRETYGDVVAAVKREFDSQR